ncbi:unnamed protein product [Schistosoma margrebowiei]|uniref:Uncharacterized protein n=1 Tax=Schistosoma margrebowiei TaxID=48269 RepID=A0A3P8CZU5_9TREM|nr:unnamed protein product [Schistosoma margrebowiei]
MTLRFSQFNFSFMFFLLEVTRLLIFIFSRKSKIKKKDIDKLRNDIMISIVHRLRDQIYMNCDEYFVITFRIFILFCSQ